jgi:hypothetical protein
MNIKDFHKLTIDIENLHKISNDNGGKALNYAKSKKSQSKRFKKFHSKKYNVPTL